MASGFQVHLCGPQLMWMMVVEEAAATVCQHKYFLHKVVRFQGANLLMKCYVRQQQANMQQ